MVAARTGSDLRFTLAAVAGLAAIALLLRWASGLSFDGIPMTQTIVSLVLVIVLLPLALRLGRRARGLAASIAFGLCLFGGIVAAGVLAKGIMSDTQFAWTTLGYSTVIGGLVVGVALWLASRRGAA